MKRKMDLVRTLLLYIEERDYPSFDSDDPFPIEHSTPTETAEHIRLLIEAGLITAIEAGSFGGPAWLELRLTWSGHDFLELARPETRWRRAMTRVTEKGLSVTIDVLSSLLRQYMSGG